MRTLHERLADLAEDATSLAAPGGPWQGQSAGAAPARGGGAGGMQVRPRWPWSRWAALHRRQIQSAPAPLARGPGQLCPTSSGRPRHATCIARDPPGLLVALIPAVRSSWIRLDLRGLVGSLRPTTQRYTVPGPARLARRIRVERSSSLLRDGRCLAYCTPTTTSPSDSDRDLPTGSRLLDAMTARSTAPTSQRLGRGVDPRDRFERAARPLLRDALRLRDDGTRSRCALWACRSSA